tara:strand:- start:8 stop:220 length:213 start_codon:yes stop_codon:yes gene_type:complete
MIDPELKKVLDEMNEKLLFLEVQLSELIEMYEEPVEEEYIEELAAQVTERVYKKICEALKVDSIDFMGIA